MSTQILIIGVGGIGSLLTEHVTRAIAFSGLNEQADNLEITLVDGDVVELRNLPHQQFDHQDLSTHKVVAMTPSMATSA